MSMLGLAERRAKTRILLELDCGGSNPAEVELLWRTLGKERVRCLPRLHAKTFSYTPPASTYRAPAPSPYVAPAALIRSTPSTIRSAPRRTVSSPTRTYRSPNASDYELPSISPATSDYSTRSDASLAPAAPTPAPATPQSSWRHWADRDTAVPTDTNDASTRASADQLRFMIMRVQAALYAKGYDPGAIDGALSERTVLALRQFQEAYGLVPTGRMTIETLNALGVALVR